MFLLFFPLYVLFFFSGSAIKAAIKVKFALFVSEMIDRPKKGDELSSYYPLLLLPEYFSLRFC